MISVLLIILKIIGISLLVIIGLLLLSLLLVLFVPVRYRFKGSYDERFLCKGKITWLLHLVSIRIDVEEKVVTSIRIFGIPLSFFIKKKKEVVEEAADTVENAVGKVVDVAAKEVDDTDKTAGETAEKAKEPVEMSVKEAPQASLKRNVEEIPLKQTFIDKITAKINALIQKIKDLIQMIVDIFRKIKETLFNIKEKKDALKRYLVILKSDTAKAAFALCKNRIFRVLKHIFPRKMRVNVTYGMSDPADTGYILAVYGMMPEFVGKRILLKADFEQQIFKGDFYVKGAIRAWTLLLQVLCILLDKNCQKLYHIVKKEISNEHK